MLDHRDETQVVGEHVHVVDRRDRKGHLELSRQVGAAVDRLFFHAAAGHLLLVQPDLVVGARVGQEMPRQGLGCLLHLGMRARLQRVGRDHHVAVDVAARGQCVDQRGVDRLHGGLELALDHPVELECLAGGDAHRVIGVVGGDRVQLQPLLRGDHAAGRARADHELVGRFELLPAALVAQVAVVLLVTAVVLDQGGVVLAQRSGERIGQALQQLPAQAPAVGFDCFNGMVAHGMRGAVVQVRVCGSVHVTAIAALRLQ